MAAAQTSTPPTTASVALVSLNEENTIGRAVRAFIGECSETGSEIIVMAGGKDRTVENAREALKDFPRSRLILDSNPRGKPAALNAMFSVANGPVMILSDGDVEVHPGSVRTLLDALKSDDVGAASGRVVGIPGKYNTIEKACDLMTEMMHLSRTKSYEAKGTLELASGYLYAIRKDLVRTVPEGTNSDDGFLSLCVRSAGKRVAYAPGAVVAIRYPRTLGDFIKQKMRTRFGHMQLKNEFKDSSPRSARGEAGEFRLLSEAARSRGHGPWVVVVAMVLTGLVWVAAYMRKYLPWLFRKRVWQPISSTK